MSNNNNRNIAAIILAAGKGSRMKLDSVNKVTLPLAEKPMIKHIVDFMHSLSIQTISVVVGHHKQTVMESLKDDKILFVEQEEQLGTGHAVMCALKALPEGITDVFVVYGDDAILYAKENLSIIKTFFDTHTLKNNAITFLTIEQKDPTGLGRVVRDEEGEVLAIVEEKDANDIQKKITEVNPGTFLFSMKFLKEYLSKLEKSAVTGEYYLTSLIDLAIQNSKSVATVQAGNIPWRGVNTKEDLAAAEKMYKNLND